MDQIEELRNDKINELMHVKEAILSDYDLQLLMYDATDRKDRGTFYDYIWFKIYRYLATKKYDKYNIMNIVERSNSLYNINSFYLDDSKLLVLELGENEIEVKNNLKRYINILNNSKDIKGVKLDKKELDYLLYIINKCKPTAEENMYYYLNLNKESTKVYKLSS